jgi:hypothetical protein
MAYAHGAPCPMPYALCPMPIRAPHVTEKGYIAKYLTDKYSLPPTKRSHLLSILLPIAVYPPTSDREDIQKGNSRLLS